MREGSKHSGQEKGGASHCGAQERLLCFEARKAAGILPSWGKVLLLSKMLVYIQKAQVPGAKALKGGLREVTAAYRHEQETRKCPIFQRQGHHTHTHTRVETCTSHACRITDTHHTETHIPHVYATPQAYTHNTQTYTHHTNTPQTHTTHRHHTFIYILHTNHITYHMHHTHM